MDTFEITIQRRDSAGWPVIVEQSSPGNLTPERSEGRLELDGEALHALETSPELYGRALGEALFAGPVHDAFRRALSRSEERLRVLLFIEDAELRALRWERLCAPIDDRWQLLALSQRAPFSRYLPSLTDRRFPPIGRQDLRALIVAASPANVARFRLEPFDVAEAVGGVQRSLEGIPSALLSDLPGSAGPPSLDAICAQLSASPFTLLHLVCHGRAMPDGESVIFLARDDDPAEVDPATATRLIERLGTLQGARGLPRLAFLSTCESASPGADAAFGGLAQRLVRELGMPAVVAMTDKVEVATANALSAAFYARLRDHGEVDRALVEASSGLAERGTILMPVLFSRLGGQPLFSDSLDRPLSPDDIGAGLGLLGPLVGERAPVLVGELDAVAAVVRRTLRADPGGLTREARQERDAALAGVDAICGEATELSFRALALGQKPPPYDGRCPFPGLHSFKADARDFFFGREPLEERLIERLARHPFLAVLGASGSGKSSLVYAGLLPALQARDPQLRAVSFTPGDRPLEALEAALAAAGDGSRVVFVDQFEEAFTICQDREQRAAFFEALLAAADASPVVITMRADFLGEVAPYPALRDQVQSHQEIVAPMTPEELRRAMELQAAAVGLRFEADLGGQILDDVHGEPGAMPLLQHALQELWERRRGRWLRAAEYRAIGGIHQAIAHTADEIYDACSPADRERLRTIFVRLTRLDREALAGEERRDTRQRVSLRELTPAAADPAPLRDLLRRLADARLVVTGVNADGEETVEVAHEALIRSWPRLRAWLEEDRAGLLLRDTIRLAAQEWQREERDPALLFRGGRLDEALALSALARFAPNELERAFLDASMALREQEAAEREAVRERELRAAQELAAEQQRRADEQAAAAKQLRRRAAFLAGVAAVAALAMVAAGFLGLQAQRSERAAQDSARAAEAAADEANQRALVANARLVAGQGQTDLALALSLIAADSASPLPETYDTLTALAENSARRNLDIPGVQNVIFSPRGDELFVVSGSSVQIWNLASGTKSRQFDAQDIANWPEGQERPTDTFGWLKQAALSSDGSLLVTTASISRFTYSLVSWGVAGGQIQDTGDIEPQYVAFLPNSHTAVMAGGQGAPVLFDLDQRTILRRLTPPVKDALITDMALSPDGASLAVAYATYLDDNFHPNGVALWDLTSNLPAHHLLLAEDAQVSSMAFSPDGTRLALGLADDATSVLDTASGAELYTMQTGAAAIAFSPDGRSLVTGTSGGGVSLWSEDGALVRHFAGHQSPINSLAFSPDGRQIVSGDDDGVRFWDINGYEVASALLPSALSFVRFSSSGDVLFATRDELGRLSPTSSTMSTRVGVSGEVRGLSPDEQRAVVLNDSTIGIWDLGRGGMASTDLDPYLLSSYREVFFAPDGESFLLYSPEVGTTVQIRDGYTAALLREFGPTDGGQFALSPDGSRLAQAGRPPGAMADSPYVTLWDVASGTSAGQLSAGELGISTIAFSPDGSLLAGVLSDSSIVLWRLETGEIAYKLAGYFDNAGALAISSDNRLLLSSGSSGDDSIIRVWDLSAGVQLRSFAGGNHFASHVAFSPDSRLVVASRDSYQEDGSVNSSIVLWRNDSGPALVEWVRANRYVRELSCEERQRYKVEPLCTAEPTPAPTASP